jgi:hypothetical protein
MNQALEIYGENEQVMQIFGYMFPIKLNVPEKTTFLPITSVWGWAAWQYA